MSVHKKLMQARITLQNTAMKKSGRNTFANYSYFELGDFIQPINQIFNELNLCGVVSFGNELATLTITDIDDNSTILITSPMSEAALKGCHAVQNLGAVQTYIRRYLWVAAMEIVEHDALDSSKPLEDKPVKAVKTANGITQVNETKSIAKSVWDEMPVKEQLFLNEIATEMINALANDNVIEAHKLFYHNNLDNEEQVALWSRFDSKQRASIKSYNDILKMKAA